MNDNDKENEATTGKCAECRGETPARVWFGVFGRRFARFRA